MENPVPQQAKVNGTDKNKWQEINTLCEPSMVANAINQAFGRWKQECEFKARVS